MATVEELINDQEQTVADVLDVADQFLAALVTISNVQFSDGFNIDAIIPAEYNYASVPQVSFPLFTASGTIGSVDSTPAPTAPAVTLQTLGAITVPEFLAGDLLAPTNGFTFYEDAYASTLLDPLKAKLLDNLTNGGYGIETADEVALFNRARDREVEAARTRIDEVAHTMAMRGFPLPPGELGIFVDRAYQDMQNKVSDASRDITLQRSKLYVENRQFTIREARELEQVLIGFHNSIQERALNVAKATVELGIALYNAQLARFKLRLDAAKTRADVDIAGLQLAADQAKVYFDGYRAQIVGYTANVQRQVEAAKVQVDTYRANVDSVKATNDARVAQAALQAKVIEATVQQNIQISTMQIENAKAKLIATVEALKFRTESVKYGSEKFFALLTALIGTINTLATQSKVE